jgi:hypothetical protein
MSESAQRVVDGRGAERVIDASLALPSAPSPAPPPR